MMKKLLVLLAFIATQPLQAADDTHRTSPSFFSTRNMLVAANAATFALICSLPTLLAAEEPCSSDLLNSSVFDPRQAINCEAIYLNEHLTGTTRNTLCENICTDPDTNYQAEAMYLSYFNSLTDHSEKICEKMCQFLIDTRCVFSLSQCFELFV